MNGTETVNPFNMIAK